MQKVDKRARPPFFEGDVVALACAACGAHERSLDFLDAHREHPGRQEPLAQRSGRVFTEAGKARERRANVVGHVAYLPADLCSACFLAVSTYKPYGFRGVGGGTQRMGTHVCHT